jgi:hypothetical protein
MGCRIVYHRGGGRGYVRDEGGEEREELKTLL